MKHGHISAAGELEIGAGEFKAKCLDILKQLGDRKLARVVVTRHGKPMAVLTPPDDGAATLVNLLGAMAGSVIIPDGIDLTEPIFDGTLDAESGILYR